jgi:predicted enzyme related to lactoylglutathione lyase
MTARLGLVILAVRDLPRAVSFYRQAFGWPSPVETPVYVEFSLPAGLRLGLYERHGFARNTGSLPAAPAPGALAATELYLYPSDLEPALARIEEAGARLLSPLTPRDWGDEAAYYADPDGNVVVLARPLDADEAPDDDP